MTVTAASTWSPSLWWQIRRHVLRAFYRTRSFLRLDPDCNLVTHAKTELALIGSEDDDMQRAINKHIIRMVREFSREGHSGSSAPYAISALEKLLRFEPLRALTGADDEWNDIGSPDDPYWQNRRCSHVFKDRDGAYDSNGRVFTDPDGCSYTSRGSRVPVTFPYTPKTEFVRVDSDGNPIAA